MPQLSRHLQSQIVRSESDPSFRLWTPGGLLQPEDDLLYYKLGNELKQYEEIEADPILGRLCEERRESPSLREVKVYSGGPSDRDELAAEIVRKAIDRIDFDHVCSSLNHAIFTGRSFAELIWGTAKLTLDIEESDIDRECYIPIKVEPKDPARLIFGKAEDDRKTQHHMGFEVRQTTIGSFVQGEPLPLRKVIVHSYGSLIGNPYGLGLHRRLYWLNNFKKEVLKLGLINSDGRPIPSITYSATATPEEIRDAEEMLKDFYKNSWMLLPDVFKVSFATSFVQGQVDSLRSFLTWFDTQASMSVLGATLTSQTDSTATRGDSSVHFKVTEARAKSDSDLLSESLKEYFVKPIVELNVPEAALPSVYRDFSAQVDKKKEAEVDRILFDMGIRPTEQRVHDIFGEHYDITYLEQEQDDRTQTEDEEDDRENEEDENKDLITNADLQEWSNFGWIIKRKLNFDYNGYAFSVGCEYLPGDVRFVGSRHSRKLRNIYGHIQNHVGLDKEALDLYIHPSLLEGSGTRQISTLWAIEQLNPADRSLDELKIVAGVNSMSDAIDLYLQEMPERFLGGCRYLSAAELTEFRKEGLEAVRDEDAGELVVMSEGEWKLYYFSGRRTAIVARSAEEARKKLRRGGKTIVKVRKPTEAERKQGAKGIWIRSGPNGESPGYAKSSKRGYGPEPGKSNHSEPIAPTLDFDWDDVELDEIIEDSELDVDDYNFDPIDELTIDPAFAESESSPYTNSALRERLKAKIKAGSKGGAAGTWSARKSQLLALSYRRSGGGYKKGKPPTKKQRSLNSWTKEDWGTKSGKNSTQGKDATGERYLPKAARDRLSDDEYKATTAKKRKGMKEGRHFVPNTKKASAARRSATSDHADDFDHADRIEYVEPIVISGSDAVLGEDEFESEGAIDLLQTLENVFEDEK